jgi:thymidylate synthase ThyX
MTAKDYTADSSIGKRLAEVQRIKLEIDRLTDLLDAEKAYLLGHAIRNDYDSLTCGAVKVSRRERPSWTYSEALQDAEAKLKERKAREQKNGTAINKPTEHLIVTFSAKVALSNTITLQKA